MANRAIIVRPASVKTSEWVKKQSDQIGSGRGRRLGEGPLVESVLNGLVEANIDLSDCTGMSSVSAKIVRLLETRFTPRTFIGGR